MSTVTSKDGTTIGFDRSGEGPALIVVGGAFQHREIVPPPEEEASAPPASPASRFTVYQYDRRGRGESGDTPPYAVEREIEDIAALIAAAGGSAFVFGGSSGATLALEAARSGLAITSLALYEPPFIVDASRAPLPRDYVSHLNELIAEGRRGDAVEYFMTAAIGMPAEAVAQMRQMPMWPGLEAVAHTVPYDGAIMRDTMFGDPAPLKRYASVTVPTLVMDGGNSPEFMHNGVQALVEVLPHGQRRTVEGQDHGIAPDVLMPILEEYFLG